MPLRSEDYFCYTYQRESLCGGESTAETYMIRRNELNQECPNVLHKSNNTLRILRPPPKKKRVCHPLVTAQGQQAAGVSRMGGGPQDKVEEADRAG